MDISQLQFRDKNPRLIKAENLEKLKNSIKDDPDFLTKRKILVNDTKDWMIVYAGNQRLRSLLALWYTEVPDEWIDIEKNIPLKLMEKRAFKDNVEYGEYDHDKLKDFDLEFLKELDLPEWELDLSELNDIDLDEEKEDSVPEPAKEAKLIEIGDIIQLWPHRIMCWDSTDKETVDTLMDGKKADMVFTDPPYWMFLDTDYSSMKNDEKSIGKSNKFNKVIWDSEDFNPNLVLIPMEYFDYCDEFFTRWADYYAEIIANKNEWSWIVRDKSFSDSENTDKMYGSNFELCWSRARHKRELARIKWKWLFGMDKDDTKSRVHPTQKPAILAEWFINKYEKKGNGLIADVYLGSWSTLIACEKTNRVCYWMELDPVYIEVIIKRYHDYTKWAREIKCLNRDLDLTQLYAQ